MFHTSQEISAVPDISLLKTQTKKFYKEVSAYTKTMTVFQFTQPFSKAARIRKPSADPLNSSGSIKPDG